VRGGCEAPVTVPHNPEVEAALIGRLLERPALTSQVVGTLLEPRHFYSAAHRLLYATIVEAFFADEDIDAMVIGETNAKKLGKMWQVDDATAVKRVLAMRGLSGHGSNAATTAALVRRDSDYRDLLLLADEIRELVSAEAEEPDEIAGVLGQRALAITTSNVAATQELTPLIDVGRQFVRDVQMRQAAREQGVELGAYFGLNAIDDYAHGLQGGELLICGGEPGVGKSAVWWKGALNFAERQMGRDENVRVGALILSLEMSPTPSAARFASMIAGLQGTDVREGRVSPDQLQTVVKEFRRREKVPLWVNHAPTLRASQLRALIAEAIRRHNVGLVVLDHFRMWDLDRRLANKNDEDEEKVRFLKEQIASAMNIALVCLAHTRKPDPSSNGRPKMSDLRGSYQVAAHADFVSFIYRPAMYATEAQMERGDVVDTQAEMIWSKNRHGNPGTREFHFNPSQMFIAN
jgi:replicative DNA helicase